MTSAATPGCPRKARETVIALTRARRAISASDGRGWAIRVYDNVEASIRQAQAGPFCFGIRGSDGVTQAVAGASPRTGPGRKRR